MSFYVENKSAQAGLLDPDFDRLENNKDNDKWGLLTGPQNGPRDKPASSKDITRTFQICTRTYDTDGSGSIEYGGPDSEIASSKGKNAWVANRSIATNCDTDQSGGLDTKEFGKYAESKIKSYLHLPDDHQLTVGDLEQYKAGNPIGGSNNPHHFNYFPNTQNNVYQSSDGFYYEA